MINTNSFSSSLNTNLKHWISKHRFSITTLILLIGLVAFEMFNYSTTDYALKDLLGDLKFLGIYWSTILAIAFCLIDFAGIAKLFDPGNSVSNIKEDWFLFGAWFLAATMNAILTWWGVSMSIVNHSVVSSTIIDPETIHLVVPLFVAIIVWITRILLIGSLTVASESSGSRNRLSTTGKLQTNSFSNQTKRYSTGVAARGASSRPASSMPEMYKNNNNYSRPEPEYIADPLNNVQQPAFKSRSQNHITSRRF